MKPSTTKARGSNTSRYKHRQVKRRMPDTGTGIGESLANISMNEAEIINILTKIETLTHEIKDHQNLCRFAAQHLPEDESWEQSRSDLLDVANQVLDTEFKIVVLGASGVGKSSVLNVLLDEGNLLPSSATGDACTAVPIEIHYNNNPGYLDVKAEIQYMTEVEWRGVIAQAQAEIDDEEDELSDRGHGAVQRVHLVYPQLSESDIVTTSVDKIVASNGSSELLGKHVTLQANDRVTFYREFRQRIGSLKRPGLAAWPMIDHVRLYVRHPLLENGLVLVDIPGMFETNQARVENAANYLEKCSAVCIMTHAARSKSDAAQQSLFSRALAKIQFDQRLDSVMLVCTKSDEMNIRETLNELEVPEEPPLQSQIKVLQQERKTLSDENETLKLELQDQKSIADYRGKDMTRWKQAKSKAAEDWKSFKPPRERLANGKFVKAEADEEDWDGEKIVNKIASLKQDQKAASSRCKELRSRLAEIEGRLQNIEASIREIALHIKRAVFRARSSLIKEQQAQQYLNAVRMYERHSTRATEGIVGSAGGETTQVESLHKTKEKIFCVSALAYSRIRELKTYDIKEGAEEVKDNGNSTEFLGNVEDTEIPALARRLKHVALYERYLRLCKVQLKTQIVLGALQGRLSPHIQEQEIDLEVATQAAELFAGCTLEFLEDFRKLTSTDVMVKKNYESGFTDLLPRLKSKVVERAISKIERHSRHPGDGNSCMGLFPGEYKALVHLARNGHYTTKRTVGDGSSLVVDINETIAAVIKLTTHQAIRGVLISTRCGVKPVLLEAQQRIKVTLDKLHADFRLHAITAGVNLHRVVRAGEQLQLHKRNLHQVFSDTFRSVNKAHVVAAKPLREGIQNRLKTAYARAYLKSGNGARVAMSNEITDALIGDNVIEDALTMMNSRLSMELDKILAELSDTLTDMASSVSNEYNGYMEYRGRKIESTGDPGLDKIRNQMISLGFEDLELPIKDDEGISLGMRSGVADPEMVRAELLKKMNEVDDDESIDEAVVKMEVDADDGETTDG